MTVESATYIDELNSANPAGTDQKKEGDDHLRLLKAVLLATFPNMSGAVTVTDVELERIKGIQAFATTLLDDADAATMRATLGAVIGTDVQAFDATLLSLAALGTAADKLAYTTGIDTWAETAITAFARTLLDDADQATAQATLGVVPGTDVQAQDAELAAIAGLTSAADRLPYFTGSGTASLATFTAAARNLLDDASDAAMRTTLGLGTLATLSSVDNAQWDVDDLAIVNGGTGASTALAAVANLGVYSGYVDANAAAEKVPSGWSVTNPSTGNYTVTHNLGLSAGTDMPVTVSLVDASGWFRVWITSLGTNSFNVRTQQSGGSNDNEEWTFTAIRVV